MRQRVIETVRRTGKEPYEWQLKNTEDRLDRKDTPTIAGTGAGKSLLFAMPAFVLNKSITWILAPLNYIQEQQVETFNIWGVSAVFVSQNTRSGKVKKEILRGDYKVAISSPEAFLDTDKLRNIVQASELRDYWHFVVIDETHVIETWSREFRKAHGLIRNFRSMLFDISFSAATAEIKAETISSLHLSSQRELVEINLGNFRSNIEHSVHRMRGGAQPYKEATQFFPYPEDVFLSLPLWTLLTIRRWLSTHCAIIWDGQASWRKRSGRTIQTVWGVQSATPQLHSKVVDAKV